MTAYTLFAGNAHGLANEGNNGAYTLGVQFSVSTTVTLTGIWFYSTSPATSLPSACCLYDASAQTQISGTLNSSPSWSGAAASGWVKCSYSSPALSSGTNYVAAVYDAGGDNWWPAVSGYWTGGGGGSGITNGPLSAPNSSSAVNGQAVYHQAAGGISFPPQSNSGYDFGVDVEVSTGAAFIAPPPLIAAQAVQLASTW